jgi:hypothetical protein
VKLDVDVSEYHMPVDGRQMLISLPARALPEVARIRPRTAAVRNISLRKLLCSAKKPTRASVSGSAVRCVVVLEEVVVAVAKRKELATG